VANTTYPPARLLSVAWIFAVHANNSATEAKICTAMKRAKYLAPVLVAVARMMKPMAPMVAERAQKGPRILKRSESQQTVMM